MRKELSFLLSKGICNATEFLIREIEGENNLYFEAFIYLYNFHCLAAF